MVEKTIFIFIQARVNSKRFPNKIFKKIGSKNSFRFIIPKVKQDKI